MEDKDLPALPGQENPGYRRGKGIMQKVYVIPPLSYLIRGFDANFRIPVAVQGADFIGNPCFIQEAGEEDYGLPYGIVPVEYGYELPNSHTAFL